MILNNFLSPGCARPDKLLRIISPRNQKLAAGGSTPRSGKRRAGLLESIKEIAIAFCFLFALVIGFSKGMEWLTEHVFQATIIAGFAMLIPMAFLQRFLTMGKMVFTREEKKSIWGAVSFVLFFVFFAFAVMDIEDYGLGTIGLPSGALGMLAMYLALHDLESLKIPQKFEDDPEMRRNKENKN